MRIAIIGNSGSGKSTLAAWFVRRSGAHYLDMDTVAWEPGKIAVPRPAELALADVAAFCAAHSSWVVEGCYADLIRAALRFSPRLLFLNPGEELCIANCRARHWERHKYDSKAEQDKHLSFLLSWVSQYYSRTDQMSLAAHAACMADYDGPKAELTVLPILDPSDPDIVAWLE